MTPKRGLEGLVVDDSRLTYIDGHLGVLLYRGYPAADLSTKRSYADCVALLLEGAFPAEPSAPWLVDPRDQPWFDARFSAELVEHARALPAHVSTMAGLSALLSSVPPAPGGDLDEDVRRLLSLFPLLVLLAHLRSRLDLKIVPPGALATPAGFLTLLHGRDPSPAEIEAFSAVQVLQLDHGLNASTFTARVVASTRASLAAALSAAVGALSGSLHGGADEAAYRFALGIVARGNDVDQAVQEHLAAGGRLMGLGHRVYKTLDPRAERLRDIADVLTRGKGGEHRAVFDVLEQIRRSAKRHLRKPGIEPNVEFYKGVVFAALGIPASLFTPVFALARAAGWCAHVREMLQSPRLYRPRLAYTGEGERPVPAAA